MRYIVNGWRQVKITSDKHIFSVIHHLAAVNTNGGTEVHNTAQSTDKQPGMEILCQMNSDFICILISFKDFYKIGWYGNPNL